MQAARCRGAQRGDPGQGFIPGRFGTSRSVVGRHAGHVLQKTAATAPVIQEADQLSAHNFITDLLRLKGKAEKWLEMAEEERNERAAILMMRECHSITQTLLKVALMQRQLDAELAAKRFEEKPEFKDVSPAVLELIEQTYEGETDEEMEKRHSRYPEFYPPEEPARAPRPTIEPKATSQEPELELPAPPEPPAPRYGYRCIREHPFHGKMWQRGQIWDSLHPDGPEPPAGSDDWELFNPAEDLEEPTGLLPTRRRRVR